MRSAKQKDNTPPNLRSWTGSEEHRAQARLLCQKWNNEKRLAERCGAQRRTSDETCKNVAMNNGSGRCRLHGGATPRREAYHTPVWPNPNAPNAMDKLGRKLNDLATARKKREERLRNMTDDERAKYDAWHRARPKGNVKGRAGFQDRRRRDLEARKLFDALDNKPTALDAAIAALQAEIAAIERAAAARSREPSIFD